MTESYQQKKKQFQSMLTVYGRKPVQEALLFSGTRPYRLHLAQSNRPAKILDDIIQLAEAKGSEILYHDRLALSRISKNGKQDQGVCLDLQCDGFSSLEDFLADPPAGYKLIALDGITNPQNLGMIIRSVAASPFTGILLPEKGNARLDALVIKASAGTLFKARIIHCANLLKALSQLKDNGATVASLSPNGSGQLSDISGLQKAAFVLGNESQGVSSQVTAMADIEVSIPMANGVESLNVAITAALIAFSPMFLK